MSLRRSTSVSMQQQRFQLGIPVLLHHEDTLVLVQKFVQLLVKGKP